MKTAFRTVAVVFSVLSLGASSVWAGPVPGTRPDSHPAPRPGGHSVPVRGEYFSPGHHISRIPFGSISILLDGSRFFFHTGLFYQWQDGGYVIINAPLGAVVPGLPAGCTIEVSGPNTYYVLNGSYYRHVPGGYMVVQKPVPNVVVVNPAPVAPAAPAAVTIWVQNSNGSRTPVEMKPSGDGQWIGPKGEYYPAFPSEAQLRPVYSVIGTIDPSAMITQPKTETLWIENMNGSKTPVELQQQTDGTWEGPNGEIYATLPTVGDLRAAYGLDAQ